MKSQNHADGGFSAVPRPRRAPVFRALFLFALIAIAVIFRFRGRGPDGYPRYLPAYGIETPDYVRKNFLTVNEYSRPGTYLKKINGVVIHYVGNPRSTAAANRNYFQGLSDGKSGVSASSHFIVGLEGEVVQCVPLTEIAYASNHRNSDTVSIEVCHPDAEGKFNDATYQRLVELSGWLCATFDLDPSADVIRHYDVTGKLCPLYYVNHPEAWDALRNDIASEQARQGAESA